MDGLMLRGQATSSILTEDALTPEREETEVS